MVIFRVYVNLLESTVIYIHIYIHRMWLLLLLFFFNLPRPVFFEAPVPHLVGLGGRRSCGSELDLVGLVRKSSKSWQRGVLTKRDDLKQWDMTFMGYLFHIWDI